ncbi:MAG: ABC transporter ATP-binding protein [Chloroflexi bacterium]|nr:MAG: ABC transporter ATP-binding protein [Chloroflexota bacterium]
MRLLAGYRLRYFGAITSLALAALFNAATFLLIRQFVDDVIGQPNAASLAPLFALGFVALTALRGLFTFMSGRWAAMTSERIAEHLRNYVYDHIQRLSFRYHDKMQTGELIQRCTSDIDAIRRFYAEQAVGFGRITLLFLVNFGAILSMNVQLGLLSVVVIPPVFIISVFFFRKVSKKYEAFQEQEARLSTVLQENLSGVRVVKAFARQGYEMDKFNRENEERYRLGRGFMLMHAAYWPVTDLITGFQMIFGFFIGALMTIDGTISVGTYLAYAGLVIGIIYPIRDLGRLIVQMSTAFVSFDRVVDIIREDRVPIDKTIDGPVSQIRGKVAFENVNFEYEPGKSVLQDITFTCEAGQTIALMGGTGSGKTSLVSLLPRFYDYTSGRITIDDIELREYPYHFLRSHIGIVEQEPFLFSRSIRENIAFGVDRDVTDEEIEQAARAAAIHDVILSFPNGYDTLVGERGVTLSGGQKQRVALARTLLKNPRILILDDATSSVDTETESEIREALQNLMEGRTTFIIAHRVQTVMNADLILVLDHGRIVQRGTHETLMREEDGFYRRIYDMQARIEAELEKELSGVGD